MIGDLHATYEFPTTLAAKAAWEKVSQRTRWITANRWSPSDSAKDARMVTIMCERGDHYAEPQFEKARTLLARTGGREIPTPEHVWQAQRLKRARVMADTGGQRRIVRDPLGRVLDITGTDRGRLRHPHG